MPAKIIYILVAIKNNYYYQINLNILLSDTKLIMIILSISINFIAGFDVAKTGDARIGFVGE